MSSIIENKKLNALLLLECVENDAVLNEGGDNEETDKVRELIDSNDNWVRNDYQSFVNSVKKSRYSGFLTKYTPEELKNDNVQTYQLRGYSIGYALKPMDDGEVDIISVHNNEPNVHGIVDNLLKSAIKNGGTQLDHFEGVLSDFYMRNGFEEYGRYKWDDTYAPIDWDFDKYGRPDVVYRRLNKKLNEMLRKMQTLIP